SPSLRWMSPAASRLSRSRTTDEPSSDIEAARSFCRGGAGARAIWTSGSQVASVRSKGRRPRSAARRHWRAARESREPKESRLEGRRVGTTYQIDALQIDDKPSNWQPCIFVMLF